MSAADDAERCRARDRAAVVTTAITHIVVTALRSCLYGERPDAFLSARAGIEELLRDEFDEIARKTRDEIRLVD